MNVLYSSKRVKDDPEWHLGHVVLNAFIRVALKLCPHYVVENWKNGCFTLKHINVYHAHYAEGNVTITGCV